MKANYHPGLLTLTSMCLIGLCLSPSTLAAAVPKKPFNAIDKVEKHGVVVELAVAKSNGFAIENPVDHTSTSALNIVDADQSIRAGDNVRFRFRAYDTATGSPLSGAFPAAWAHPSTSQDPIDEPSCQRKTQQFVGSGLFSRAEVDLNTYYVLALNDDPTISVVDPLFGFGGSRLLAMLPLPSVGYDWAKNAAQSEVYVSAPATDQIIKIDTASWQTQAVKGGDHWQQPKTVILQDDQQYLWVAVKRKNGESGVAVFSPQTMALEKLLVTGDGILDIVLSSDGRFVFVLNALSETLSVVETQQLEVIKTLKLDTRPVSMAFSPLAQNLYVSHEEGQIFVIDGAQPRIVGSFSSEPGAGQIRFSPDGRWGFLINPEADTVSVIDASKNRIVQKAVVEDHPQDISFSENLAYIRHRNSSTVLMITLDDNDVGREGTRLPAVDTIGGDNAPGLVEVGTPAAGIVQAPGSNAVLIANYHDKAVYFYKEGMAAPMGQFGNSSRSPRAVMAIDRSLRETRQPGIYETSVNLQKAGLYDVVYFMDSPRIVHCFTLQVKEPKNSAGGVATAFPGLKVLAEKHASQLAVGSLAQLEYRLSGNEHASENTPISINALITSASGLWRERQTLNLSAEGRLLLAFTPPLVGYYYVNLQMRGTGKPHTLAEFTYQAN